MFFNIETFEDLCHQKLLLQFQNFVYLKVTKPVISFVQE